MGSIYEDENEWQYVFIAEKPAGEREIWGNTQFSATKIKFIHAIEDMEFGDEQYSYLAVKEGDKVILEWKEGEEFPQF
jgi:formylmethanofuran dehydrogenase subunit D